MPAAQPRSHKRLQLHPHAHGTHRVASCSHFCCSAGSWQRSTPSSRSSTTCLHGGAGQRQMPQ